MGIADEISAAAEGISPKKSGAQVQLTSNLQSRLTAADAEYRKRYGAPLPVTSKGRSTEQQSVLYANRGTSPYPVAPPGTSLHETGNAFDVDRNVPESFLNEFGLHRPVKNDPVHVQAMPDLNASQEAKIAGFSYGPQTEAYFNQPAVQKPKSIAEQMEAAAANVAPESKTPTVAESKSKWFGRKLAGYADVVAGLPGQLGKSLAGLSEYAVQRGLTPVEGLAAPGLTAEESQGLQTIAQGKSAEEAAQARQAVEAKVPEWMTKPVGTATGTAETPEYQNILPTQIMGMVNEYGIEPAKAGLVKMGMNPADASAAVDAVMTAVSVKPSVAGVKALPKVPSKIVQAGRYVAEKTPEAIKAEVRNAFDFGGKGPTPTLGSAEGGAAGPSVGAAGTSDVSTIRAALATATPEMQTYYKNMPLDKVNTPTVLRHLEADSLPVPIRLTKGQATGDIVQISHEQNLRGKDNELAYHFNDQNQRLIDNFQEIRNRVAPDVHSTKTIEASENIIDAYKKLDEDRNTAINEAYKKLEDANGGQFPVDGQKLVENADAALHKKLKSEFLPASIRSQLERFRSGEPMSFENFEALRTNIAAAMRTAERTGDGNAATALSIVRNAMEELPLADGATGLKSLADTARKLARERFDKLEKDPAYKAAINESVPADKFFEKFVINGVNKNLKTMVDTFGVGSPAHQHMAVGTINWLKDKAGIVDERGNFSQAGYNKALKKLQDVKNLEQVFTPEGQTYLQTLGNVANYTQFQPRGSFVNNSNTLVGYLADKGKNALEAGANIAGLRTINYPIGSEVRRVVAAGAGRKFVKESLAPGAGSSLKDIAKSGK